MIDKATLFNYKETQQLNALEKLVSELSHKVALQQNEINNIKKDISDEKKRKLYYDQM